MIAKTVGGKTLVLPIPETFVVPIPIELVPTPVNGLYSSSWPVTKKWFGILNVESRPSTSTIELLDPSNSLLKIGSSLWVRSNAFLTAFSVPS